MIVCRENWWCLHNGSMQRVGEHKGNDPTLHGGLCDAQPGSCLTHSVLAGLSSELFESLKVYLKNPDRLQPIIGLCSIIECVTTGPHGSRETLYLCEVCECRHSKADMRNHIIGSLHRFNYIKAWHPHLLSEWREDFDMALLAWPLMELAKTVEAKEGPGDIKLLQLEDAAYQRMTRHRDCDAAALIKLLRLDQHVGEPTSTKPEHHATRPQSTGSLSHRRRSKKSLKSQETLAQSSVPPRQIHSTAASSIESEDWLDNVSPSQLDNTQMSTQHSVQEENNFIDGYTGSKPLIGLLRVVECRDEGGCVHCFLCHCCRVRMNAKNIIAHATSSSHLLNYLMESHPEQVERMMPDINDNCQLLLSLAEKVEQEQGRGKLKVVEAPESLCIQLTGKSYHWCVKMLCKTWTHTNAKNRNKAVKGRSDNKTTHRGVPEKRAFGQPKRAGRVIIKRNKRKAKNTLFKVSLPLSKGSVLLERTSFSMDDLPVSFPCSPLANVDLSLSSHAEDCDPDCDSASLATNQTEYTSNQYTSNQQDFCSGDAGEYMEPNSNPTATPYFQHFEPPNYGYHRGMCYTRPPQEVSEGVSSAMSHPRGWSSNVSPYRHEDYAVQWDNSSFLNEDVPGGETHAVRCSYPQQPQYTAPGPTGVSRAGFSDQPAPQSHAVMVNWQPFIAYSHVPRDGAALEPGGPQTHMALTTAHVQMAQQRYVTQPVAYPAVQAVQGEVSYPSYSTGPWSLPNQYIPPAVSDGGASQSNPYAGPSLSYDDHSDINFRGSGWSAVMLSGNAVG
ncbi:uncharacterized protein ACBR49_016912 [Aulostomus maculatus]